jgi:hypothetical protein
MWATFSIWSQNDPKISNNIDILLPQIDWITISDYSNDIASMQSQINHITIPAHSNDIASYNLKLIGKRSKMTEMTLLIIISNWSGNETRWLEYRS